MASRPALQRTPVAAAVWLLAASAAFAQASPTGEAQLEPVVISGRAAPPVTVAGWGDTPLARLPLQASVFTSERLQDRGAQRLSDLIGFDPAIGDAYNSEGYWDFLTVRGFVLDNRFNYRRDGLPINAETSIPLDNKQQIEILKGTSGIQSGTSAPGGLVNFVVKRPLEGPLRRASIMWRERGSVTGAVDLSERFGAERAFGLRLNVVAAQLDPKVRDAEGSRRLLALAGDWRLGRDTVLEAEIETSHRSQPSVPGFSMLGNTVPAPTDPRINLNNQPWSLPVVLDGDTASLRWRQRLSEGWQFTAHAATQRLRSDDRVAFPFGVFDPTTYECPTYCDRFAPDGTYTMWEFRSDNEHRRTDALAATLDGRVEAAGLRHDLGLSVLQSRVRNRFGLQVFDIAGTGNIDGTMMTPPSPQGIDQNTDRDEHSTELSLRDAIHVSDAATVWLGVRHTRLHRQSVRTDSSRPTDYKQSFSTPFVAASYSFATDQLVYASWGQGIESSVAPNRDRYTNRGEALPPAKSRQIELGLKGSSQSFEWGLAAFDIDHPLYADFGTCDAAGTCTSQLDGTQRHRGVEATGAWQSGPWTVRAGAQALRARRAGSLDATRNGLVPANVAQRTLKAEVDHRLAALPGLTLSAVAAHEGSRFVLPDNSASIPGYTRFDLAARYDTRSGGIGWTWRAGIDNVTDERAWRESPYQFGHAYLFPLAPRTVRISVQADL
jgi:iron complex outermembrane receptor protein